MTWQPLIDELARWADSDTSPRLWLRDDDAVAPTAALDRFLALSRPHNVPVLLAVIPAGVDDSLAERVADEPLVSPAVHGWAHINHAPEGEKSQELGSHRPADMVLSELTKGFDRLTNLFGARLTPILVPPWNRIDADIVAGLPGRGFKGLSTFGHKRLATGVAGLAEINTHVDLIDWKGTRGCRDHDELIGELAGELERSREGDKGAVGILTHHLVHDASVDRFLGDLFAVIDNRPHVRWVDAEALLMGAPSDVSARQLRELHIRLNLPKA